jgi:hypothetical protein
MLLWHNISTNAVIVSPVGTKPPTITVTTLLWHLEAFLCATLAFCGADNHAIACYVGPRAADSSRPFHPKVHSVHASNLPMDSTTQKYNVSGVHCTLMAWVGLCLQCSMQPRHFGCICLTENPPIVTKIHLPEARGQRDHQDPRDSSMLIQYFTGWSTFLRHMDTLHAWNAAQAQHWDPLNTHILPFECLSKSQHEKCAFPAL